MTMIRRSKEGLYWADDNEFHLTESSVRELIEEAKTAKLRRARINVHKEESTPTIHEMVVALCDDSYLDLHKHPEKSESYHLVQGKLLIATTDNESNVKSVYMLTEGNPYLRIESGIYHFVMCLSEIAVYIETTIGPFDDKSSKYYPWKSDDQMRIFKAQFI